MREARRHGDALMPVMNYCIRREDRFHALDCHWHSEMELFRVMQGTLTVQCGTDLFEAHAGDIVFFNSGELHAAVPVEAGEELYFEAIVFSPDLLCSTANDIIRVKYIQPVLDGELTVPRADPSRNYFARKRFRRVPDRVHDAGKPPAVF